MNFRFQRETERNHEFVLFFERPPGEAGARYADHVAAVIRWPNPSVRLAAVEATGPPVSDLRKSSFTCTHLISNDSRCSAAVLHVSISSGSNRAKRFTELGRFHNRRLRTK